jgi:Uncharacterized protein conserved in bacteria
MEALILTKAEARKIILHAAGLCKRAQFGKGYEAVYKVINHLGFVQIDANYVVERAHHHALFTRVPDYQAEWLDELQADGRVFEYYMADAGYIPMQHYRFSLPVKKAFEEKRKPLTQAELNLMQNVLDRVEREGPLMVKDFDDDREVASTGWWDWRPSKIALERLYLEGKLMVTRNNFQKVYDLPFNILPDDIDTTIPAPEEFARHIIMHTLQCLGIAYAKEMNWRARFVKNHLVKQELAKLVTEGKVLQVAIKDCKSAPLYMLPKYKKKKIELAGDVFILSPFDVLNTFRHRLKDFFDFDYQIECFVPVAQRKYGYFSLPILAGDSFVARMDSKANRKKAVLTIHNLHFEPGKPGKPTLEKIREAINQFARFNQCQHITLAKTNNKQFTIS